MLDPTSVTRLELWTPTTDIPLLAKTSPEEFTKDAFLHAPDAVCCADPARAEVVDHLPELEETLSRRWREQDPLPKGETEVLAYDITSVRFFGVTCPISAPRRNPDDQQRLQVNVRAVVSRHDRMLWRHLVYRGNRRGIGTMRNLLAELQRANVQPGLLIVDRGLVNEGDRRGGTGDGVAPPWWALQAPESKGGGRYPRHREGSRDTAELRSCDADRGGPHDEGDGPPVGFRAGSGRLHEHRAGDKRSHERNEALSNIGKALTALSEKGKEWSEAKLHAAIQEDSR